jgi:hypothetical protein
MKLSIAAVVLVTLFTTSCRSKPRDIVIEREAPAQPQTIVIEREHVHGQNCGHYYHNGVWYAEPEHITVVKVK